MGSGPPMLCADMHGEAGSYTGSFGYLASYLGAGNAGYGPVTSSTGTLRTPGIESYTEFSARDANGNEYFAAHLHAQPCSPNNGGVSLCLFGIALCPFRNVLMCAWRISPQPHYSGGDGVTVDAINENWPAASCAAGSGKRSRAMCSGDASNDWVPSIADLSGGLSIGQPPRQLCPLRSC